MSYLCAAIAGASIMAMSKEESDWKFAYFVLTIICIVAAIASIDINGV